MDESINTITFIPKPTVETMGYVKTGNVNHQRDYIAFQTWSANLFVGDR